MDWLSIPVVLKVLNWARARLGLNREHDCTILENWTTSPTNRKLTTF